MKKHSELQSSLSDSFAIADMQREVKELRQKVDNLEKMNREWNIQMARCVPSGSEFYNNPVHVADYIVEDQKSSHDRYLKSVLEIKNLNKELYSNDLEESY